VGRAHSNSIREILNTSARARRGDGAGHRHAEVRLVRDWQIGREIGVIQVNSGQFHASTFSTWELISPPWMSTMAISLVRLN